MTRKRYIQIEGELVEVSRDFVPGPVAPMIFGDLPDYQSPVTGKPVSGRVQRREDLKRTGCRPWEGREQEVKEAARQLGYEAAKYEGKLDADVRSALWQMSPEKRKLLASG